MASSWKFRATLHSWFSKFIGLFLLALFVMAIIWGRNLLAWIWHVLEYQMNVPWR